ncbi:MAG: adenylate/guanylate cyclase domain-containing protein, partial [Alphaproteobacteria bacterium]
MTGTSFRFCAPMSQCASFTPFIEHSDHTWNRGGMINSNSQPRNPVMSAGWQRSPLRPMITNSIPETRYDLTNPDEVAKFPLFSDFQARGGTDYIAFLNPFGDLETASRHYDGVMSSWLTDRKGGFETRDIAALRHLVTRFAAISRLYKREQALSDVLDTYLGPLAATQVLDGKHQRGDGEKIEAVIWICDLRGSSALADAMEKPAYLALLNQFFECLTDAVMLEGGEVLKYMGDGFLAIFPTNDGLSIPEAGAAAVRAAQNGAQNLAALHSKAGRLQFGVGIHHGDVMFGNIGAKTRLDFSVIGPAVNTASRLQDLTKVLKTGILVSDCVARHVDIGWHEFPQKVPGLKGPVTVLTP